MTLGTLGGKSVNYQQLIVAVSTEAAKKKEHRIHVIVCCRGKSGR